jgi:glycosyltransferase involved in cell wall biosynthesis
VKLLLVTSRYPWPPRRGDQIRSTQLLDFWRGEHEVTLLTPEPETGSPESPVPIVTYRPRRGLGKILGVGRALVAGRPLQNGLFESADLGRRLRELAPWHDLAVLQLARLAGHLEDLGELPLIADLIDSLSLNLERRARFDHPLLRPLWRWEGKRLARAERALIARARRTLVVCERDRHYLKEGLPAELAERIAVVPIALASSLSPVIQPASPVLALTGNLGYFVNADAALWWLREVWPRLRSCRPEVRVVIAGARPTRQLRRAAARAGVELLASPPDLLAVLARATLALAPMRSGSGMPLKILEAWSLGVPVVASEWAAAGTTGKAGEDFAVAGDDPDSWVEAILRLLDTPERRRRLAENGRRRLAADYSREAVAQRWRAVLTPV